MRTRRRRRALSSSTARDACSSLVALRTPAPASGIFWAASSRRERSRSRPSGARSRRKPRSGSNPGEFLGGYPDRYGDEGIYTLNLYWSAQISGGALVLDEELAEVGWFGPEELPDPSEFAFRNTVEALRDWKAQLGSKPSHK
jgi:hypothetical protein